MRLNIFCSACGPLVRCPASVHRKVIVLGSAACGGRRRRRRSRLADAAPYPSGPCWCPPLPWRTRGGTAWWAAQCHPKFPRAPAALCIEKKIVNAGGAPTAARCGGVTNPTTEHRDAVGRSEAQLGVCIAHPGLSPGPINRRLRSCGHEVLYLPAQPFVQHGMYVCRKMNNSQARTGHQRGMGGRGTDDDDTHERHTDTNKLTRLGR